MIKGVKSASKLHNEHVYKYYRFQGWINGQSGRPFASFIAYEFAEQERAAQKPGIECKVLTR